MRDDQVDTKDESTPALSAGSTGALQDWALFAVLAVVGAGLRLFSIEQWSFGAMEAETFRAVTQPLSAGPDGFTASEESRYPAVFLLVRWLLGNGVLQGFGEGWLRLPFAFAGCLLPPLMALFARPVFGRAVAFLLALLLAVHPAHIAASQTANPAVFSVSLAVMAGLAQRSQLRVLAWLFVIAAGGCHPIGWLVGIGMICAGADRKLFAHTPKFVWWVLALHVVVLVPALIEQVGLSVLLLALLAIWMRPTDAGESITRGLSLAALLPLVGGGAWWWFDSSAASIAALGALPALVLLASWSVVRFFHRMRRLVGDGVPQPGWLTRLLAAAPAIMLLGELLTTTFLYFFIYSGGRPPWRDVRNAALAALQPGHEIRIVAVRGCDVMRIYLRPSHWQYPNGVQDGMDPHPGTHVDVLPADLDAARELLVSPDVMLVLQHDELAALLAADGGKELVADFEKKFIWASPQPSGDHAIYLLQRRSPN